MATKTISILDRAYEALKREKAEGESFSDTILKITGRRVRLMDSFSKWKLSDKEFRTVQKELQKTWKNFKK